MVRGGTLSRELGKLRPVKRHSLKMGCRHSLVGKERKRLLRVEVVAVVMQNIDAVQEYLKIRERKSTDFLTLAVILYVLEHSFQPLMMNQISSCVLLAYVDNRTWQQLIQVVS